MGIASVGSTILGNTTLGNTTRKSHRREIRYQRPLKDLRLHGVG